MTFGAYERNMLVRAASQLLTRAKKPDNNPDVFTASMKALTLCEPTVSTHAKVGKREISTFFSS